MPRRTPGRRLIRNGPITQRECTRCGACCCNARSNAAEGFFHWVEIAEREPVLADDRLRERLVTYDDAGIAHLRLDPDGRCLALRGRLGRRVECTIYDLRPKACRRVEAGSDECLKARADRGIA